MSIQKFIAAGKKYEVDQSAADELICAAEDAMPEIVELVGLIRPHWLSSGPIVIDEEYANRIRELVGQ